MFDEFFNDHVTAREGEIDRRNEWFSSQDIQNANQTNMVWTEVPRVDPTDINATMSDDLLTFSDKVEGSSRLRERKHRQGKRLFGSFKRPIERLGGLIPESVTADHNGGMVTITISRRPSARRQTGQVQTRRQWEQGPIRRDHRSVNELIRCLTDPAIR